MEAIATDTGLLASLCLSRTFAPDDEVSNDDDERKRLSSIQLWFASERKKNTNDLCVATRIIIHCITTSHHPSLSGMVGDGVRCKKHS